MKIKIYEDRSYSRENFSNEGTENENLATTLYFQFPETVNGVQTSTLNKYIVFDINGEPNTDILTSNNSYSIPTAITQLGTVSFNIYLVAPTNNGEDSPFRWISKKITLNFNDANDMTEIVITVEEINIFNSLLSELNSAIANVELLEDDFEEFKGDYDDLKKDFEDLNSDFLILNQNYQAAIQQVENVNIDANKINDTATVTITNKDGIQKEVTIKDGIDYEITSEDYQEIANIVEQDITPLIPTKVSQLENDSAYIKKEVNNLTNYYKKDETYTKQEVDNKVASVYKYKGTVATYADLPSLNLTIGDVYNVESDGSNYAWNGTAWDKLGGEVDLSDYYTKSQTDTLLNEKQNIIDNSHKLSADLVDDTSTTHKFTSTSEKNSWNAKYDKPSGGIPSTDMSSSVQTSLEKAETAIQDVSGKEDTSNKTGILDENSTDTQYPNAKTVYDNFVTRDEEIEKLQTENAQLIADHPDILDENNEFPSGTDLTLNGTGDLKMKVDVGGNSTQVQYRGKNKLSNLAAVYNTTVNNGVVTQSQADTRTDLIWKCLAYNGNTLVQQLFLDTKNTTGLFSRNFTKDSSFNKIRFGLSGSETDSMVVTEIDNLPDGEYTLSFDVTNTTQGSISWKDIMITSSSETDLSYEPYVGNQASPNPTYKQDINNVEGDVVVKGSNKNRLSYTETFEKNTQGIIYKSKNGKYSLNGTSNSAGFLPIYSIKPYTIRENDILHIGNNQINSNVAIVLRFEDDTYLDYSFLSVNRIINIPERYLGKTIVGIHFYINGANITFNNLIIEPMILKGVSTVTDFIEYAENSVTFPLSQGQKLMLGDTLEDDGIHHKRGQIVLTGNENISSSIYGTNSYILGLPARAFVDETITLILSSHFKGIPANQRTTEPPNCIYVSTASLIEVRNTEFATLQEFKAWLAQQYANNTPVIVEYKLETETIETYTSAQQTAYNKLKEMQSYYDLTYVTGSSDNAQPILTAHAKKSIKELSGADLSNYQTKITSTNKLNSDLVTDINQTNKFVTASEKEQITTNATDISNIKDGTSIDSFGDVETALSGKEDSSNKVTSIDENSTDTQYPSAKSVYNLVNCKIYGIKRSLTTTSSEWHRTDDSIGLEANATKDGSVTYNDFDNIYPWSDIYTYNYDRTTGLETARIGDANFKFDGTNGEVLTKIPEFYYRRYRDDDYEYIQISKYPIDGFIKSEEFSVGRYDSTVINGTIHSYSNTEPEVNRTITSFRDLSREVGNNFGQLDWRYFLIHILYLVEYADYNSQNKLGSGATGFRSNANDQALVTESNVNRIIVSTTVANNFEEGQQISIGTNFSSNFGVARCRTIITKESYDENGVTGTAVYFDGEPVNIELGNVIWTSAQKNGVCDNLGMKSGCYKATKNSCIYRGVENPFGNVSQIIDGINIKSNIAYICYNPEDYEVDTIDGNYRNISYTNSDISADWVKKLGYDTNNPLICFPTEVGGSDSTNICDSYTCLSASATYSVIAIIGGYVNNGTNAGMWFWDLRYGSNYYASFIGSRLLRY